MTALPVVEFEFFAFIKIVWLVVEYNHVQENLQRLYVEQCRNRFPDWAPR